MRAVCARQTPRTALGRCKPASVPVQRRFATQSPSGSPHPKKGGPHQCWSCKVYPLSFRDAFFCGSCGTVQPETNEVDCFQKIGLCALPAVNISVTLRVDHSSMISTLRTWTQDSKRCRGSSTLTSFTASRRLHPVLVVFTHATQREQELSDELSKAVNRCYRTLKDPNLRGLYMARAAVCLSSDAPCAAKSEGIRNQRR